MPPKATKVAKPAAKRKRTESPMPDPTPMPKKRTLSNASSQKPSPVRKRPMPKRPSTLPKTTAQWELQDRTGFDCLEYQENCDIEDGKPLGEFECLVEMQVVSLNYRDLGVANDGYPFPVEVPIVPCSDGSGIVRAVGEKVTEFKVGDHVCTLFNQLHQYGPLNDDIMASGLGALRKGTLRQWAHFPESGLVLSPTNLTPHTAATLPCAYLTAWNALYGLESKALKPGDWVLCQGTGGVSCAAAQFAVNAGARVVVTTSDKSKGYKLEQLLSRKEGEVDIVSRVQHVLRKGGESVWWEKATEKTNGEGFDHIIEVGGPDSMWQSLKVIKMEGVINVIGFVGGTTEQKDKEKQSSTLDALRNMCTIRGLFVGSKAQFKAMNRAIEAGDLQPIVDKTFEFKKAIEAYNYMAKGNHFSKVLIQVAGQVSEKSKKVSPDV